MMLKDSEETKFFLKKLAKSKQERPSCSDRGTPGAC